MNAPHLVPLFLIPLFLGCTSIHLTPTRIPPHPSLQDRIQQLQLSPSDFFYKPKTKMDQLFYQTGLFHYWQLYGKTSQIQEKDYLGYILFADPYHRGLKKISFLLGADCSNFVHRTFQILGAEFRFLKTRQWIHLGQALSSSSPDLYYSQQNQTSTPIDLDQCEWNSLLRKFVLVPSFSEARVGDIVIYPRAKGILGTKGHMGFVIKTNPIQILQSKYSVGITSLPPEPSPFFILRWQGPLRSMSSSSFHELLQNDYENSISTKECA